MWKKKIWIKTHTHKTLQNITFDDHLRYNSVDEDLFCNCMKSSGYLTTIRSHFKKFFLIGWWAQLSVIDRLLSNHYHSEHWLVILSALMPFLICAGPPRRSVSVAPSLVLLQLPVKERNLRFFTPITYSQVVNKSS